MDELCDLFSKTTLIIPDDERKLLYSMIEKCNTLKVIDTIQFLDDVYQLLKRYRVHWMGDSDDYNKKILKATLLYFHNYETLAYENNTHTDDIKIYIMFCIAKSILTMIKEEIQLY